MASAPESENEPAVTDGRSRWRRMRAVLRDWMPRWKWGVVVGIAVLLVVTGMSADATFVELASGLVVGALVAFTWLFGATALYRVYGRVTRGGNRPIVRGAAPTDKLDVAATATEEAPTGDADTAPCRACGTNISTVVVRCPQCGYEPKNRHATGRLLFVLFGALLTLTVVGAIVGIPMVLFGALSTYAASKWRPSNKNPF